MTAEGPNRRYAVGPFGQFNSCCAITIAFTGTEKTPPIIDGLMPAKPHKTLHQGGIGAQFRPGQGRGLVVLEALQRPDTGH
jgi:hypothetical protein